MKSQNKPNSLGFSKVYESGEYNHTMPCQTTLTVPANEPKAVKKTLSKDLLSIKTMKYCSRYDSCEAPKCPLDILIKKRSVDEGDPQCGMARATRHKYWLNMSETLKKELPYQGYFQGEYAKITAARQKWESMSEERRQEVIDRLRKFNHSKYKEDGPQWP